ncbi:MAG: bifunctional phosphoribosyl-AMP cyclohydrolase/phosphoribosyl-ATP diphosphatase HisIE [Solirubrobacterales bacterium]
MSVPEVVFGPEGLAPCIAQDAVTGEVLMLAWMNREALEKTIQTGEIHFFSRSRGELWRKGETSGNVLRLIELRVDCDEDALLALVDPTGPACHTGERTCFYRRLEDGTEPDPVTGEALGALARVILERRGSEPSESYTARLLADPELAAAKVTEEAAETVEAVRDEDEQRVAEEAADLLYHLAVLLETRGIGLDRALEVLNGRRS